MKFKPLRNRALVKLVEPEEQTASGIVLPDTAKEKPQTAEVRRGSRGRCSRGHQVSTAPYKGRAKLRLRFRKAARKSFSLDARTARRIEHR